MKAKRRILHCLCWDEKDSVVVPIRLYIVHGLSHQTLKRFCDVQYVGQRTSKVPVLFQPYLLQIMIKSQDIFFCYCSCYTKKYLTFHGVCTLHKRYLKVHYLDYSNGKQLVLIIHYVANYTAHYNAAYRTCCSCKGNFASWGRLCKCLQSLPCQSVYCTTGIACA